MSGNESIVRTFVGLGKPGEPTQRPEGVHQRRPAGEHFMTVALVPYVENQSVPLRVIDTVQRDGQLYSSQI